MKKLCSLFIFCAFLAGYSHGAPTLEQIQRYAQELGVPVTALQQLIEAYNDTTGLTNSHAVGATILSLQELLLMRDEDTLKVGAYYRVRTTYNYQTGRRVSLGESVSLAVDVDFLVIIPRYSPVDTLFLVRADNHSRPRDLRLVELAIVPK